MRKATISVISFGFLLLFVSAIPPAMAQSDSGEISFWESVRDSKSPAELEAYLKAYPHGKFSTLARIRLDKLKSESHGIAKKVGSKEIRPAKQAGHKKPLTIVKWQEKTIRFTNYER